MGYTIYTTPSGERSIRKIAKHAKKFIHQEILTLQENPKRGSSLRGRQAQFLRSLHLIYRSTHYRVAYEVVEKSKEIYIHYVGTRENFYQDLLRSKPKSIA
jgi:mRNA-degrading endonuclease RelE of RelBE toxin-antitoxin system